MGGYGQEHIVLNKIQQMFLLKLLTLKKYFSQKCWVDGMVDVSDLLI